MASCRMACSKIARSGACLVSDFKPIMLPSAAAEEAANWSNSLASLMPAGTIVNLSGRPPALPGV